MIVTLRAPQHPDGTWPVEMATCPREGETVELADGSWTVHRVVHYPSTPGTVEPRPPYVVIRRAGSQEDR